MKGPQPTKARKVAAPDRTGCDECLITRFEEEELLDRFGKEAGDLQGEHRGGDESAILYGVNRLTAYSYLIGQLLLGHAYLGTRHTNSILHR